MKSLQEKFKSHTENRIMIFPGTFRTGATEIGLISEFRNLNWLVESIGHEDFFSKTSALKINKIINKLMKSYYKKIYRETILELAKKFRPDVLFTVKGLAFNDQILSEIQGMGIPTVCFYPDCNFSHPLLDEKTLLKFDIFITTKSYHKSYLNEKRAGRSIHFVPHGYNQLIHLPLLKTVSEGDYTADVRYISNHSSYKQHWIEGLAKNCPDLNIRISGNLWKEELSKIKKEYLFEAHEYSGLSYSFAIQKARINIAVHHGPSKEGWQDLVSTRTFEIPACGGFMLHIDNDEVREYYDVGAEIDVFSTVEELVDKCRFYLKHDDLRRRMAEKAYARCVPHYSYKARAAQIDRIIRETLGC